ncbi:MAG: ATP-binding protein [Euzebyales bacterium]|nr:ATP-binding protein [Euzebyales bacterium]
MQQCPEEGVAPVVVALQLCLPAQREAPASARRALTALSTYVSDELFRRVELVVSELVTNSVRHAGLTPGDSIHIAVHIDGGMLRGEVADPGTGFDATVRLPCTEQTGGYGLFLVSQLTNRWGVADDGATRVWFELLAASGSPSPATPTRTGSPAPRRRARAGR